jgi:hypothetical protein
MSSTTATISERGPGAAAAVLDRAADALTARRRADVALLVAAVELAELHRASAGEEAACWGEPEVFEEGASMLGGPGARWSRSSRRPHWPPSWAGPPPRPRS